MSKTQRERERERECASETEKKNRKMASMSRGLTTLHVTCQKMLGLWPIMNSMSLLNLEAEAKGPLVPRRQRKAESAASPRLERWSLLCDAAL